MPQGLLIISAMAGIAFSALSIALCASVVWLWPGFVLPLGKLAAGWLVHAAGIGAAMAMTLSSTLPGPAAQALAVGTAALVVFGVMGLRRRNAWVFFACLALMSFVTVGG